MLFAASVLCIGAIAMLLHAHAEYIEYTDEIYQSQLDALQNYPLPDFCIDRSPPCIVEIRNMTQSVHRVVDGEPIFEERTVPAQYYRLPPDPELEGCTKTGGIIRWDAKFEDSKILPDLQRVIDSGAERLCITIMPNIDPKSNRNSSYLSYVKDDIYVLLSRDGVQTEWAPTRTIWAAIPASLLDELVDSDLVANIDVYGKKDWLPRYVLAGYDTKFGSVLQMEMNTGMKECLYNIIAINNVIHFLDDDNNPVPEEEYTIDYGSRILEYEDKRIVVKESIPRLDIHNTPRQSIITKCPLEKNDDGQVVFNLYLGLTPVEYWPNGSPGSMKIEEWEILLDKRDAEVTEIVATLQQPVIDLLESNGQTVLKRGSLINFIDADITEDFLPLLEEVDAIEAIASRNGYGTFAGCLDCNLTDQDEVSKNPVKTEQFPTTTEIILNANSAIINVTMTVIPNFIPIPSEIMSKDITVNINNRSVTDYDIIEATDGSQLFLALQQDDPAETVKPDDKIQPIPSPRKQIADGVQPKDLFCGTAQYPTMMNDRVVCITDETAQILIDRGFDIVRLG